MPTDAELKAVASIAGRHKMKRGQAEHERDSLIKMFVLMCADHDPQRLFDIIREFPVWKRMDSSAFGITSTIGDYTNKKGETFKAHFTTNGYFIKKAGRNDVPISYFGNFKVMKGAFVIDMEALDDLVGKYMGVDDNGGTEDDLKLLFKVVDLDDMPLEFVGNTGRIARA